MWSIYPEIAAQGAAQWHRQAIEDRQLFLLGTSRKPAGRRSRLRHWLAFGHQPNPELAPLSTQR